MEQRKRTQTIKQNHKKPLKKQNKWCLPVIAVPAFVVLIVGIVLTNQGLGGGGGKISAVVDQDVVIPISKITATAKFYPLEIQGTKLEVLAVKASDGTIRTVFNTCQICYSSGRGYYKQSGDVLVCQNCYSRFQMDQVEVASGGCNPVPIFPENKTVDAENITVSYAFLNEAKKIFSNWKVEH